MSEIDTSTTQIEWPRVIWAGERMPDEISGYHVFSEHATIPRFDGDIDREREFHCYVDADIFDSEQRYHEHQRSALASERDAAVARAEQAKARAAELEADVEQLRDRVQTLGTEGHAYHARRIAAAEMWHAERDALKAEIEKLRAQFAAGWIAAIEAAANYLQGAADDWRSSDCELPARKIEDEIPGVIAIPMPADAGEALDRLTAQALAQGMREAAEICRGLISAAGAAGLQERKDGMRDASDAILARAEEIEKEAAR